MFKKPFKISQKHNQAGKERKKLKSILEDQFDKESISQAFEDTKAFIISKIEKTKTVIISNDDDPLLVDTTGKCDYYPTIYFLNMYPAMVKTVFYLKPGVEHFILKGANLMWPGVHKIHCVKNFHPEELVAIITSQNIVCAIGATACDHREYEQNKGRKGVAALILHYYGDELYNWGSKQLKVNEKQTQKESIDSNPENLEQHSDNKIGENCSEIKNDEVSSSQDKNTSCKVEEEKNENDSIELPTKEKEDDNEKSDELIMEAFLNAIKLLIKDEILPVENSYLWNRYIVPCKRPDTNLDIKSSSYKKLGKFYQEMDKQGLIRYEEASKKVSTPHIVRINWQNPLIKEWKPTILEPALLNDQVDGNKVAREKIAKIDNLCKPQAQLKKYLSKDVADYILYDNLVKLLADGLTNLGLMKNSNVIVSEELKKNLNLQPKSEKKSDADLKEDDGAKNDEIKSINKTTTVTYKSFIKLIEKWLIFKHQITLPSNDKPILKTGKFNGILIVAEKIQNKYVTKVFSLPEYGIKLEPLLTEWQVKYGTSGTIHNATSNKDIDRFISLQGIFLDELKEFLINEFKISKSTVETLNKTGKTKKKK